MTFADKMLQILHVTDDIYSPHVTGAGSIPNVSDSVRNDYDRIRSDGTFHGGVDIIYGKEENQTLKWIGSNVYPNNNLPTVYAPVTGKVINRSTTWGGISILADGYVHTIYHMELLDQTKLKVGDSVTVGSTEIGKMSNVGPGVTDFHVHYEITTYYLPSPVARISKIDPEAFWDNYPASADGFFTLSGSYKIGNQFYGTENNEILKGEGVKDGDAQQYANFNDMDILSGGGGSDIIDGGTGDDKLYGGNSYGEKQYYEIIDGELITSPDKVKEDKDESADTLIGGMGKDELHGGKGDDILYGGVATIANGEVTYNESEDEDDSDDKLYGEEGNDTLYGGKGDDTLYGGDGNDELYGGKGDDVLYGGEAFLNNGEVIYDPSRDEDTSDDKLYGEEGDDTLYGGKGNDSLNGGEGDDALYGGDGKDELYGEDDTDYLYGEDGNDTLDGGLGVDYLYGGDGYDTYRSGHGDIILDSDHKGAVHFIGKRLTGGVKEKGKDYWEGNGGKYYYNEESKTLRFELGDYSVTILNYDKDQHSLGIYLEEDKKESKQDFSSPLVLDLNNNDILSVTEYESPAYFDLDGDGFKEKTGWIEAEDGLLALDKDQNGTIDNGNELFGSYTKNDQGRYFNNGFAALSSYDINEDGIINASDDIYSSLNVWIDANQDGISQTDELHSLESLHINSINLDAQEISDSEGLNLITHESTFVQQQTDEQGNVLYDEQGEPLTEELAVKDVWFYRRSTDTLYEFDQEIPPEVLALPDMKGAGSEFQFVQAC